MISAGEQVQKIGITGGDPKYRLASLQTASHTHLSLVGFIALPKSMARQVERRAHDALAAERTGREWFAVPTEHAVMAVEQAAGLPLARPQIPDRPQRGPTRTAAIGIRVEPAIKEAVERAAAADRRTVASLTEKVLVDWLKANGHLPTDAGE